jgi:hypothetical protein
MAEPMDNVHTKSKQHASKPLQQKSQQLLHLSLERTFLGENTLATQKSSWQTRRVVEKKNV